jgi:hypothetical protein
MSKIRDIPDDEVKIELAKIMCSHTYENNKSYVYLLDFGNNYYKFGVSKILSERLRNHFYKHHFYSIVKLWKCENFSLQVERCIKVYADNHGIRDKYRGEVEIIRTDNISPVISFIDSLYDKIQIIGPRVIMKSTDFYTSVEDILKSASIDRFLVKRVLKYTCKLCNKILPGEYKLGAHLQACIVKSAPSLKEKVKNISIDNLIAMQDDVKNGVYKEKPFSNVVSRSEWEAMNEDIREYYDIDDEVNIIMGLN